MNIIRVKGEVMFRSVDEIESRSIAIRFICIPGKRPVMVPAKIPRINASIM